jgi:tRNA threonylcarbamoyladenosine biosynthesis protein TsaE
VVLVREKLRTHDDTVAFGRSIGSILRAGDLVLISGPLGAGKTVMVKGIAQGLGIASRVSSPTFVIARVHPAGERGVPLLHVDAYRLGGDLAQLDDLDLDTDLQDAVIAAENHTFKHDAGVDPIGIARAMFNMARGGDTQSGSTITQQFVKNNYLSQEQTLERKAKELLISIKVGATVNKRDILEGYLNTAYFGRGAHGIQAAAKRNVTRAIERVASELGNTPAICRKCYVHPEVFEAYFDGTLLQQLKERVEEDLRRFKKMPIVELLDLTINQTLSRTVLTGLTTLLAKMLRCVGRMVLA